MAFAGKVVALPKLRKASFSLTLLEFAHSLVLMLWVGSLAGFGLVVGPALLTVMPDPEMAFRAMLAVTERSAFLGCGAGALLLLTTLLMHLLSLRQTRTTIVQMLLLLVMTGAAVASQIWLSPQIQAVLASLPASLAAVPAGDPLRAQLSRLNRLGMGVLTVQVVAGMGVLFFAVRRWYRYLPGRTSQRLARESSRI
ncbi:MAG: DUF4149 domain-containing protein [Candidatus Eisenbacteria bacterium]|nr:DUF4149 domain-containing protein [Candidatus Eisenbacteria bacterium]